MKTGANSGKIFKNNLVGDRMPIYGYHCKSCNHSFEVTQSVNDDPVKECPKCGGPVGKIFFPVGISFKGSGFYTTDYKSTKRLAAEKTAKENAGSRNGEGSESGNGSGCSTCASVSTCGTD